MNCNTPIIRGSKENILECIYKKYGMTYYELKDIPPFLYSLSVAPSSLFTTSPSSLFTTSPSFVAPSSLSTISPSFVAPSSLSTPLSDLSISSNFYNIIEEEHETNFGHNKVIWKCDEDFNWDDRVKFNTIYRSNGSNGSYGSNGSNGSSYESNGSYGLSYGSSGSSGSNRIGMTNCGADMTGFKTQSGGMLRYEYFNSKKDKFQVISNQKKYFKLYKYIFNNSQLEIFNEDEPLLSISLFVKSDIMKDKQKFINDWIDKYFYNQIRLLLAFKLQFPRGNVRCYFDKFLMDYLKTMPMDTNFFKFSELNLKNIENSTKENFDKANKYFISFLSVIDNLLQIQSLSVIQKFLISYYFAGQSQMSSNGDCTTNNTSWCEFLIYEFADPFIDHKTQSLVSNGFVGSCIRFLPMLQEDYTYKSTLIKRPRHVVVRDGHANSVGAYDAEYIRNLNNISKQKQLKSALVPVNFMYERAHMDDVICGDEQLRLAPIAGELQFCNFSIDSTIFNDLEIVKLCAASFIISSDDKIKIYNHLATQDKQYYNYGIDEYLLSILYQDPEFNKYCIYFQDIWIEQLIDEQFKYILYKNTTYLNPIQLAFAVILHYLISSYMINDQEENWRVVIRKVETLRNKHTLLSSAEFNEYASVMNMNPTDLINAFGVALSIIPNVYHLRDFLYMTAYGMGCSEKTNVIETINKIVDVYMTENNKVLSQNDAIKDIILKLKHYCNVLKIKINWCVKPQYIPDSTINTCDRKHHGFYDVTLSENDFILRKPEDIPTIIDNSIVYGQLDFSNIVMSGGGGINNYYYNKLCKYTMKCQKL